MDTYTLIEIAHWIWFGLVAVIFIAILGIARSASRDTYQPNDHKQPWENN